MAINIDTKGKPIRTYCLLIITAIPLASCAIIGWIFGFEHEFNYNLIKDDGLRGNK